MKYSFKIIKEKISSFILSIIKVNNKNEKIVKQIEKNNDVFSQSKIEVTRETTDIINQHTEDNIVLSLNDKTKKKNEIALSTFSYFCHLCDTFCFRKVNLQIDQEIWNVFVDVIDEFLNDKKCRDELEYVISTICSIMFYYICNTANVIGNDSITVTFEDFLNCIESALEQISFGKNNVQFNLTEILKIKRRIINYLGYGNIYFINPSCKISTCEETRQSKKCKVYNFQDFYQ